MEEAAFGGGGDLHGRSEGSTPNQNQARRRRRASLRDDNEDGRAHTSVQDRFELGHEAGFETADPLPPRCPFTLCSSENRQSEDGPGYELMTA